MAPDSSAAIVRARPSSADARRLAAAVDSLLRSQVHNKLASAAAIALVVGDAIILKQGYGVRDAARGLRVDPDSTLFAAASVSKVLAAIAVLQLENAGRLSLTTDVRQYLPDVLALGDNSTPVTARSLLTHTAGFEARFLGSLAPGGIPQPALADFFRDMPMRRVRPAGEAISYSNFGSALAGYLAERVSGMPFYEYAEREIFAPLGMSHSSFRQPLPAPLAEARVRGARLGVPTYRPYPAAALVATVADMGRLVAALLADSSAVVPAISPRLRRQLTEPAWRAQPGVPGATLGMFERWGPAGNAVYFTGDGGDHSLLYLLPAKGVGLYAAYSSNDESAGAMREQLARVVETSLTGSAAASGVLPEPPAGFAARAAQFTGVYRSNQFSRSNIERLAALPQQFTVSAAGDALAIDVFGGGPHVRLVEVAPLTFRSSDSGYVAFRTDAGGTVRSLYFSGALWDPAGADRAAWYTRAELFLAVMALACVLFGARLVLSVVDAYRRWRRVSDAERPASRAWRASAGMSALFFAAPLVAPAALFTQRPPYYAIPWSVQLAVLVATAASILGAALPLLLAGERGGASLTRARRMLLMALAVAGVLVALELWQWNLVWPRA